MLKKHVSAIGNSILSSNLISISVIPDGNLLVPVQKLQRSTRLAPSEKKKKNEKLKEWVHDGKKKTKKGSLGVLTSIHQGLSLIIPCSDLTLG